ncbi:ABC transporter substrate-binding protein [Raoultibacter massiliensis]|uniref:ABC transporter substrate-binding protein n=1 Tax=Raoultibacter massiliensis TaxID=1852371 RepID=A0ABV1JF75_9ACTN|nr:ABC transporter substrate-binding protein [Raoultibacter massiliensis]
MKRKIAALLMACMLALPLVAGCSSGTTEQKPAENKDEQQQQAEPQATEREITDMAGRTVTIPTEVNSVYCAVPTGEAMVATLSPEKIIGWVNEPSAAAMEYLPENLASMPVIGGWMGQQVTANMEDIITLDPDIIIYVGTDGSLGNDDVPDQIQKETGIPVVCASSALERTAEVYRTLGDWIGEAERGEELATYYETKLADVVEKIDAIPDSERPRVYYAENSDGLATDPAGSSHTEVLDYCKVTNVADVEMKSGQGRTEVSIEQVIAWDPELILCHSGFVLADDITSNPQWADIQAVKDGEVYTTPAVPFNWFDRPPNVMRLMGIQWFATVCYPDIDIDINQETKDFYKLFYKMDLSDEQVESLLNQNQLSFN